jgi:2,3-bisphosphoglycerate-independent phosphoglycerate mutase
MSQKKLLLIILDGWGVGPSGEHNAVYLADTSYFDSLFKKEPTSVLAASGREVGLIDGQIGSSEVGHMHIGSGRVIMQELTRIQTSLEDGSFYQNEALRAACEYVKNRHAKLHLVGLLSDGGVHSHIDHLFSLLELARDEQVPSVFVHAFLDGRDTPPASSVRYREKLARAMSDYPGAAVATLCGRYYAMDRNGDWELTQKAVDLLTGGKGREDQAFEEAVHASYKKKVFDEFVEPVVLDRRGFIEEGDSVICFNFRADRMRQLIQLLYSRIPDLRITTMIPYGADGVTAYPVFERDPVSNHLCELLSKEGVSCLKIAETQKYPHLTYFLNGTREKEYAGERRIMIDSKKVRSFDEAPQMSAPEITRAARAHLDRVQVIMINYANADMVGHTGNLSAGIAACECVDRELRLLVEEARRRGYDVIITADHGNAEEMYNPRDDSAHTAHTTNPVPFILLSDKRYRLQASGGLVNVAPTALSLMGMRAPREMAESLLR